MPCCACQGDRADAVYDSVGDGARPSRGAPLGARGVGVDIDPFGLTKAARMRVGRGSRIASGFLNEDLFLKTSARQTVVTLFSRKRSTCRAPEAATRAQARHPHRLALDHMGDWNRKRPCAFEAAIATPHLFWIIPDADA